MGININYKIYNIFILYGQKKASKSVQEQFLYCIIIIIYYYLLYFLYKKNQTWTCGFMRSKGGLVALCQQNPFCQSLYLGKSRFWNAHLENKWLFRTQDLEF